MTDWLWSLEPRERALVIAGALILGGLGLYLLVAEPLWQRLQDQRERHDAQAALLSWMQQSAAEVQRLRTTRTPKAAAGTSPPYLLLDAAVRRVGLPAPVRLEPRGRDGASAQFENIPFDGLIRMLGELDRGGALAISDVSVTRRDGGLVNASVVLSKP